jgi:hypothetical protein
LQIEGRSADDLQDVGSRRLLLEGLAQLIEQSRIFDRDDGLAGEVCDECDLFFGEGFYVLPVNSDCTDHFVGLDHWHAKQRACVGNLSQMNR